jgi:acetolactate synthase I/II/III large subunit
LNGAESLIRTLVAGGVEACFTNPGTSELHIVAALDRTPEIRCLLVLYEGVATGAADGYARMARKPACTLLHLGPGLANGVANLHNARRAQIPIVNIVGDHANSHLAYDAPLNSDIEGIARPVSHWLRISRSGAEIGRDAAEAIAASRVAPGHISTLIVRADAAWSESGVVSSVLPIPKPAMPSYSAIEEVAAILRSGERTAFLLSGDSLFGKALVGLGRIAAATQAKLLAPYPFTRLERGAGRPRIDRIPYIFEQAVELLEEFQHLVLIGAQIPFSYFAHPGKRASPVPEGCKIHVLATAEQDCIGTIEALVDSVSESSECRVEPPARPEMPRGTISAAAVCAAIGALLPEGAIVVEESMTSGRDLMPLTRGCPPHDFLANTGGSIGIAMPLAVGAAVACPTRRVLCLSADGSGMYTQQALWSMARAGLNITTIVFANREYAVLKREYNSFGLGTPGERAKEMFEIGGPNIDWVSLAKSMGVQATRPGSMEEFGKALGDGCATAGPRLIEVTL